MKPVKIRILKDTPFDKAGDVITFSDFRLKYNYICLDSVSDDDLIHYLSEWKNFPDIETKGNIGKWFLIVYPTDEPMPLYFIYEGLLYSKEIDGLYHIFILGNELTSSNSIGVSTIDAARKLLLNATYKSSIIYITSNVNKKVS